MFLGEGSSKTVLDFMPHFQSAKVTNKEEFWIDFGIKNRRKFDPDTLLARVVQQVACERRFFQVRGRLRRPLRRSWGALGALLGPSWALSDGVLWGRSSSDLGAIMSTLGNPWTIVDRPRMDFEGSWIDFGRPSLDFRLSEGRFWTLGKVCFRLFEQRRISNDWKQP